MENVRDVAKWFLSKESMTHKKLQKLCYYSQAWYCALFDGSPLFEDIIQAWIHGPVIPTLYHIYSDYKWLKIPSCEFDCSGMSADSIELLESIWNTFSEFDGDQLEAMTHFEDPWKLARGDLKPWEPCTNVISINDMRTYYRKMYDAAQND